jgi:hypothetical protein
MNNIGLAVGMIEAECRDKLSVAASAGDAKAA